MVLGILVKSGLSFVDVGIFRKIKAFHRVHCGEMALGILVKSDLSFVDVVGFLRV
jgi:hypothetical protein